MTFSSAFLDGVTLVRRLSDAKGRALLRNAIDGFRTDWTAASAFFGSSTPASISPRAPLVVLAGFLPYSYIQKMEGVFAEGFRQKGFRVMSLHSPGDLLSDGFHRLCFGNPTDNLLGYVPWQNLVTIRRLVDAVLAEKAQGALRAFTYRGSPVGLDALATSSGLDPSGDTGAVSDAARRGLRKLLIRSCLLTDAADRFLHHHQPAFVVGVEKGVIGCSELFHRAIFNEVPFIQWHGCHEPNTIMMKRFHHGNIRSHPFSISAQTWGEACARPWDETWRETVLSELEKGYGANKWFSYKRLTDNTQQYSSDDLVKRLRLDPRKKTCILFAPVLNDANLFFGKDLFDGGFREWLIETVRAAASNPRINWVLKIHPANRFRRAAQGIEGEYGELTAIREALGEIPTWLRLLLPEDDINPLSLFKFLDIALTVRGTVGAEIPCFGKPVLTGGTGRYSGLGFTIDSATSDQYLERLRNLDTVVPLSEDQVRRACLHAYLFFRVRPAPYGQVAEDLYQYTPQHPYHRDLAFLVPSVKAAAAHPQYRAMIDWMTDSETDDFLNWGGRGC